MSKEFKFNKKVDIIIHAAELLAHFIIEKPLEALDVAINGTRNCLKIAKKTNQNLFFSSSEIYGDPQKVCSYKGKLQGNVINGARA